MYIKCLEKYQACSKATKVFAIIIILIIAKRY